MQILSNYIHVQKSRVMFNSFLARRYAFRDKSSDIKKVVIVRRGLSATQYQVSIGLYLYTRAYFMGGGGVQEVQSYPPPHIKVSKMNEELKTYKLYIVLPSTVTVVVTCKHGFIVKQCDA